MRRGEVWTAAGGKNYAGKPRPVLVVQDDRFDATDSITRSELGQYVGGVSDTDMLALSRGLVVFLGLA